MIGQGKKRYVYKDGVVLTMNAATGLVITANRIKGKVRLMRESDYCALPEFLYQAIFIPEGAAPPPRNIINDPQIFAYIEDFGVHPGDLGVVAEQNGQVVGAAWTRLVHAYGQVDEETPELAVSILPEFRGLGIGTRLIKKMFEALRANGYTRTSLSVQKDNPAVRLYERLGYRIADEKLDPAGNADFIMIKDLKRPERRSKYV